MNRSAFRFSTPDRGRVWQELALTMSQASSLTGVSERQIQHWMDKGYIDVAADGGRKISGSSLDLIMLIRQARQAGVPLRQAVPLARTYLRDELSNGLSTDLAQLAAQDLSEKLTQAGASIDTLRAVMRNMTSA
ncbi:MAG: MerR family transcriptional regulator [Chloroflexota bacterium]